MRLEKASRLKIYVGESDRWENLPAYKAVVHFLREKGFRGATVTQGVYGFGKRSLLHASSPLRLSMDMPIIIEAVDRKERFEEVLPQLVRMVRDGLITLEDVTVVHPPE